MEDGTEYYERVPADNPTGILALVNAYDEVDCHEDEATVLERYAAAQERNCFSTGSCLPGTLDAGAASCSSEKILVCRITASIGLVNGTIVCGLPSHFGNQVNLSLPDQEEASYGSRQRRLVPYRQC